MNLGAAGYGDSNAGVYDYIYPRIDHRITALLCDLAGEGAILALGVGTGRCAKELVKAGRSVVGVDASVAMLSRCRQRAPAVSLIRADLAALPFRGGFPLAYSLVSSFSLLIADEQRHAYLRGVAEALNPGGLYVDESNLAPSEDLCEIVQLELTVPLETPLSYRVCFRPITASGFDDLALSAGLQVRARWKDWQRRPWRSGDPNAISVFQKINAPRADR